MPLTRKQWTIAAAVTAGLVVVVATSVTVGVLVGRRKPASNTVQQRAHRLLDENPLIDG